TSWTDRNTCVLFGDGAGAAVLRHRGSAHGLISTRIGSDGRYTDILFMPGGGTRCPITRENANMHLATIHMTGKEVYKQAVIAMLNAAKKALDQAGLSIEDIACVIPHQANLRIIEAIADRLGISRDKMFVNLDRYGNTSAAAVAIALDEANRSGRAIDLAEKYPAVYAIVGVHPTYAEEAEEDVFTPLHELAKHPRVVAIGETGLDYHRLPSEEVAKEEQVQVMSALRTETDEEI